MHLESSSSFEKLQDFNFTKIEYPYRYFVEKFEKVTIK